MIRGRFDDISDAAFIDGYVYIPRLDSGERIQFLVDTGAHQSLVMPTDSRMLHIDFEEFEFMERTLGVGGYSNVVTEPAEVSFMGDHSIFTYDIDIAICVPRAELMGVPSLLGRDILNRWCVTYNRPSIELLADVISTDRVIEL